MSKRNFSLIASKKNSNLWLALILSVLLIIITNLGIYSFRSTEDTPCWTDVSTYLFVDDDLTVSHHCLYNPAIPIITYFISFITHTNQMGGYFFLNTFSLLISSILLFHIVKQLSHPKIALLTSGLFLFNFTTQYYTFSAMPDSFTWLLILAHTHIILSLASKNISPSTSNLVLIGLFFSLSILSKLSFVFFLPAFLLSLLLHHPQSFKKYMLVLVTVALPLLAYYSYVYTKTQLTPLSLLSNGYNQQSPTFAKHLWAFTTAYLYLTPFIVLGFFSDAFNIKSKLSTFLIFLAITIPIFLWPFTSFRFTYTTFLFGLPLASAGIYFFATKITPHAHQQRLVVATIFLLFILLSTLRVHLTLTNTSHLQFIMHSLQTLIS